MSEGKFIVKEMTLYWEHDGTLQRVGQGYEEVSLWWRTRLAEAFGVEVDTPEYDEKITELFGEDA